MSYSEFLAKKSFRAIHQEFVAARKKPFAETLRREVMLP